MYISKNYYFVYLKLKRNFILCFLCDACHETNKVANVFCDESYVFFASYSRLDETELDSRK